MIVQNPFGITNKRIFAQNKTAAMQFTTTKSTSSAAASETKGLDARSLREHQDNLLKEAHERVRQQQQAQRRRRPRRQQGSVRLSNTDSIGRAMQIRTRLLAKLNEVASGDMDDRTSNAVKMDIKLQLERVERQIANIRRRERAVQEERTTRRRDDTPERRRRRLRDMQEQRIYIRRDFLFHANRGGFDPNDPMFSKSGIENALSSVAFEFGGEAGTIDTATPDAGMEVDFNMEVVL